MLQNVNEAEGHVERSRKWTECATLLALLLVIGLILFAVKCAIDKARSDAIVSTNKGRVKQILLATEYALEKESHCVFDPTSGIPWKKSASRFVGSGSESVGSTEISSIFFRDEQHHGHSDILAVCVSTDSKQSQCCDDCFVIVCSDIPELQVGFDDQAVVRFQNFVDICTQDESILTKQLIVGQPHQSPYLTTVGEFIATRRSEAASFEEDGR